MPTKEPWVHHGGIKGSSQFHLRMVRDLHLTELKAPEFRGKEPSHGFFKFFFVVHYQPQKGLQNKHPWNYVNFGEGRYHEKFNKGKSQGRETNTTPPISVRCVADFRAQAEELLSTHLAVLDEVQAPFCWTKRGFGDQMGSAGFFLFKASLNWDSFRMADFHIIFFFGGQI